MKDIHFLLGVVLMLLFITLSSCLDRNCYKFYAFEFPLTVTPKDTFTIGDTIWWEMNVPNQLLDQNTGNYIDVTNFELYFDLFVSEIDSTVPIPTPSIVNEFIKIVQVGRLEPVNDIAQRLFVKTTSLTEKHFRFGLVPTRSATYDVSLNFPNIYYDLEGFNQRAFVVADPNCREYITQESTIPSNQGQSNYYLLTGVCQTDNDGIRTCYTPDQAPLHQTNGSYAFHVKAP